MARSSSPICYVGHKYDESTTATSGMRGRTAAVPDMNGDAEMMITVFLMLYSLMTPLPCSESSKENRMEKRGSSSSYLPYESASRHAVFCSPGGHLQWQLWTAGNATLFCRLLPGGLPRLVAASVELQSGRMYPGEIMAAIACFSSFSSSENLCVSFWQHMNVQE